MSLEHAALSFSPGANGQVYLFPLCFLSLPRWRQNFGVTWMLFFLQHQHSSRLYSRQIIHFGGQSGSASPFWIAEEKENSDPHIFSVWVSKLCIHATILLLLLFLLPIALELYLEWFLLLWWNTTIFNCPKFTVRIKIKKSKCSNIIDDFACHSFQQILS